MAKAFQTFLLMVLMWNSIDDQVLVNLEDKLRIPLPSEAVLTASNVYLPLAFMYRAQILHKIRLLGTTTSLDNGWMVCKAPSSEVLFLLSSLQL